MKEASVLREGMEGVMDLIASCWTSFHIPFFTSLPAEEFEFCNRKFRAVKQVGEGGYSMVYLVRELSKSGIGGSRPENFALKKMSIATSEQMMLAKQEISVLQEVKHPHVIPLLEAAIVEDGPVDQEMSTVYMLFPWFKEGTAMDVITRLHALNKRLSPINVLDIFRQICNAVAAVHSVGYAHRDIKPHNVLLRTRQMRSPVINRSIGADSASAAMLSTIPEVSDEESGIDEDQVDVAYSAVLTDFGSVGPSQIAINNRTQALQLQEDAQAHCSMPYRPPELYDVPSVCLVDERADVWSLGCLLYFLMYGVSPFEGVLNEAGGSIALAVINGRVSWPKPPEFLYPSELHSLVVFCLDTNMETRPTLQDLLNRIHAIIETGVLEQRES